MLRACGGSGNARRRLDKFIADVSVPRLRFRLILGFMSGGCAFAVVTVKPYKPVSDETGFFVPLVFSKSFRTIIIENA